MKQHLTKILGAALLFTSLLVGSCKTDPCDTLKCQNGGTCASGACKCPEGYSGTECATQKTPSKVRISKIEVLSFNQTAAGGGGWDLTSGGDIYPEIYDASGTTRLWTPATYFIDATSGGAYSWDVSPNLDLDGTTSYKFLLYDDDSPLTPDFMGGFTTTPFTAGQGFPTTLTWTATDGSLKLRLTVSYIF